MSIVLLISGLGIVVCAFGTLITLHEVITKTPPEFVKSSEGITVADYDNLAEKYYNWQRSQVVNRKKCKLGMFLIGLGSLIQIAALFF